jgi:hypothetical protein
MVRQHEKQQAELAQQEGKRVATDRKTKALKSALEELRKEAYILSRANSRQDDSKKCNTVFELMLNYASQGLKWAA